MLAIPFFSGLVKSYKAKEIRYILSTEKDFLLLFNCDLVLFLSIMVNILNKKGGNREMMLLEESEIKIKIREKNLKL